LVRILGHGEQVVHLGASRGKCVRCTDDLRKPRYRNDSFAPDPDPPSGDDRSAEVLTAYYRSPAVRSRIAEYCDGEPEHSQGFRALGLAGYGGKRGLRLPEDAPVPLGVGEFERLLDDGADVCRSLADRGGTLIQMDIDYVDRENPADVHLHPEDCFARIEPVYREISSVFQNYGVPTIDLLTARGYHLSTRIPGGTPFHAAMLDIGKIGAPLRSKYNAFGGAVWVQLGRAHEGAGRLLEYLVHRSMRSISGKTAIPVVLADTPCAGGGPYVCLDLSAYGDPLFARNIRCAFSSNQKRRELTPSRPYTISVPCRRQPFSRLLQARETPAEAVRLAECVHTVIPDARGDDLRWVEDYRRGALAQFHQAFDRGWHDPPDQWPRTYDRLDLGSLPPCVRLPLERPNPALLQPLWIRTVALALWGMGWHPRSVAGLVRSKYERDYGWGSMWYRYDAAARADFYVRLFCGALACGVDADFSCELQAARGACPCADCPHALGDYKNAIERRQR
jgi:hypothetical protein